MGNLIYKITETKSPENSPITISPKQQPEFKTKISRRERRKLNRIIKKL